MRKVKERKVEVRKVEVKSEREKIEKLLVGLKYRLYQAEIRFLSYDYEGLSETVWTVRKNCFSILSSIRKADVVNRTKTLKRRRSYGKRSVGSISKVRNKKAA